ncbi:MAG: hypothetical protein ACI8QW_000643, partial [Saprospiraceae bacterium]
NILPMASIAPIVNVVLFMVWELKFFLINY